MLLFMYVAGLMVLHTLNYLQSITALKIRYTHTHTFSHVQSIKLAHVCSKHSVNSLLQSKEWVAAVNNNKYMNSIIIYISISTQGVPKIMNKVEHLHSRMALSLSFFLFQDTSIPYIQSSNRHSSSKVSS